ncbi:MAG: Tol-Pal system beta propeller repeat protein TolB [Halothiobacillaceae bacterium]
MTRLILKLFAMLAVLLVALPARAALQIDITQGTDGTIPIAVVPFRGGSPEDIAQIVSSDLARSGQFNTLAPTAMPELPMDPQQVNFGAWRAAKREYVVVGRVRPEASGYAIDFYLLDVNKGGQLTAMSVSSSRAELRMAAHRVADIIYEAILGIKGAFATRIAYVTESGVAPYRTYGLEVADSDGYNPQTVLESREPIMSPAWSPDGRKLAYVSFETRRAAIYVQDLYTGRRERVASFPGINGSPSWSPDGSRLALTLSKDGNPEVYVLDLATRQVQRVTNSSAIDTEATWLPDGSGLVFTSDRGGRPQIYQVGVDGSALRRLTFDGAYNARPSVSADGRYLATVQGCGGGFCIAVQDLKTGSSQVLSKGPMDESPSFAPNGSMLLYATNEGGRSVLKVLSVEGRANTRLSFQQGKVRDPAWGPFRR